MNKIRRLIDWLNERTKEYDEGHPTVSDEEYDNYYFKLVELEKETGIIFPDSPTQKITYEVVTELEKIKHEHPMLSLAKTKDWTEFKNYFGDNDVVGMLKLDGLTCSLTYENGELVRAETRGNGLEGENIIHNAKVIPSIPNSITAKNRLVVDGEIICTKKDFEPFSADYKNPRNFAAGSIRLLDAKECSKRNLTFIVWNVVEGLSNNVIENFETLKELGFETVPWVRGWDLDAKEFLIGEAETLGYPIDGLVGRFNDIQYGENLGVTAHHSKAAFAFKMYDEEYETELLDIIYDVSRNGILTPVAVFEPIDMDGSVVERASLHNISVLYDTLHIPFKGQKIKVFKANMIIPQISWAEDAIPEVDIEVPEICPCCGKPTEVKKSEDGIKTLYCTNEKCTCRFINRVDHFCSLKGLNIKGLSRLTLEKLEQQGWLESLDDLFLLQNHQSEWEKLDGFGAKSVQKILDAISISRITTFEQVITAAGIPLIGSTVAKVIGQKCDNDYNIFRDYVNKEDFSFAEWEGFGDSTNNALKSFDYTELDNIVEKYLSIEKPTTNEKVDNPSLANKTFVITGKLSRKRDDIKADIEAAGGKVTGSVSAKTSYLVCNDKNSTTGKSKDAKDKGIPIITEDELMEILNG